MSLQSSSSMRAVNPTFEQEGPGGKDYPVGNPPNYVPYQGQSPPPPRPAKRTVKSLLAFIFVLGAALAAVIVLSFRTDASSDGGGGGGGVGGTDPAISTPSPVVGVPLTTSAPTAPAVIPAIVIGEFTIKSQLVGNTLDMELSVAKLVGWMAIGLGGSHGAVDSIHCSFDAAGTATVIDSHQTTADGLSAHRSDVSNDVTLIGSSQDLTLSVCRFSRLLNTGDTAATPDAILAASQVITAAVAYGPGPIAVVTPGAAMAYVKHVYYTKGVMAIPAAAVVVTSAPTPLGITTVAPTPLAIGTTAPVGGAVGGGGEVTTVLGEFTVKSMVSLVGVLEMELSVAKAVGWMAIGLGGSHGAVDSIHCSFDAAGTATVIDSHQTGADGFSAHRSDISNDVTLVASSQDATLSVCRFSRLLNTGDTVGTPDYVVVAAQLMIAAVSHGTEPITLGTPGAAMVYTKHSHYTKGQLNIPAAGPLVTLAPTGVVVPPGGGEVTAVLGEVTVKSSVSLVGVVEMELSVAKAVGWMAIGLGGSHGAVDSIHCSFDAAGTATVIDSYQAGADGFSAHRSDISNDVTLVASSQDATLSVCRFSRLLNTGDTTGTADYVLVASQLVTAAVAHGTGPITLGTPGAAMEYTQHQHYTKGTITMPAAGALTTSAPTPGGGVVPPGGLITTVIGEFTVKSTVTAGVLQMELSVAKAVGWMAIGFGGAHGEYDSIHCSFGAANAVYDTYCTAAGGPNLHVLDPTSLDVTLVAATSSAALTTCTFSRLMNTGDSRGDEILVAGQPITVGLGYGLEPINADNGLAYLKHTSTALGPITM